MQKQEKPRHPALDSWAATMPTVPQGPREPRPKVDGLEVYDGVYARAEPQVWTDPESGCQYLVIDHGDRITMTPRLDAQGQPKCRG